MNKIINIPDIKIPRKYEAAFMQMSDTEAAECLRDIFKYYSGEKITKYSSDKIQFFLEGVIFPEVETDIKKYSEKVEKNREAAFKRWKEEQTR